MTIQDKNTTTGELSYFETTLLLYLKESHPHIADAKALVRARADEAAGSYERAIRDGLSVTQALELADAVLYQDLRFSRFDTVFEVVSELVSRSAARKTGGFLPEGIVARRNSIQQISHRRQV